MLAVAGALGYRLVGQATPAMYQENGNQYVVISAGGHGKLGTKQGDSVVAFRLTDK